MKIRTWLATGAVVMAMTLFAGAADVGTIRNDYPGDTEAQAQMLHELGLFRGTEKGFELEKPMTRAEAAAMLTRFLGAEQKALAGTWQHPFADVPDWADKYVGWLYENGLTKGVSATQYGAEERVTCGQYVRFLSRAIADGRDSDIVYQSFAQVIADCGQAGFVRGDAVALSARMLHEWYRKETERHITLAQHLVQERIFTTEQLKDAAWDVLPRNYAAIDENGERWQSDATYSCTIAGVPVLRSEDPDIRELSEWSFFGSQLYAYRMNLDEETRTFFAVDPQTLQATPLFTLECPNTSDRRPENYDLLYAGPGYDYIRAGARMLRIEGTTVHTEKITFDPYDGVAVIQQPSEEGNVLFLCKQGVCVIGPEGWKIIGTPEISTIYKAYDKFFIAEYETEENTTISTWTWAGEQTSAHTVENDSSDMIFWPRLLGDNGTYFWGGAGLYRLENERLTQVTSRAVHSYAFDESDQSYVLLTHEKGRITTASKDAYIWETSDTLVRLHADGSETALLPKLPEGALLIYEVTSAADGKVTFVIRNVTETMEDSEFTCVLENGHVTVTDTTESTVEQYGENAISDAQKRLDELGIGIGA